MTGSKIACVALLEQRIVQSLGEVALSGYFAVKLDKGFAEAPGFSEWASDNNVKVKKTPDSKAVFVGPISSLVGMFMDLHGMSDKEAIDMVATSKPVGVEPTL